MKKLNSTQPASLLKGAFLGACLFVLSSGSAVGMSLSSQAVTPPADPGDNPTTESASEVIMIKLQGGLFQWGMIEDHTPEELSFRRMDNGGLVVVPWTLVEPAQELELRTQFGYVDLSGDEIMVSAEKLILRDGREVIGQVIGGRAGDSLQFKTQGRVLTIPKTYVKNYVGGLQVPALDVLSKDELYNQEAVKLNPEDPESLFDLGVFCERILDFKRALEHYSAAQALDPTFKTKELVATLSRISVKVENQTQVDFLNNVDRLSRRDKFADAFDQLVLFDAQYEDSPLAGDRLKLEKRITKRRHEYMRKAVAEHWFSWMTRLAGKAAREMTFTAALEYMEESLSDEIVQNIMLGLNKKWPDLEEEQVRQFFLDRKPGRWKPSSYGLGTWLLGEEAALKDDKGDEKKAKPILSERDKERAERADQIARWLRNQELSKRSRRSEEDESEMGDAWAEMRVANRRSWIIAYYAENSGDLFVHNKPELRNCQDCGGIGVKYEILSGYVAEGSAAGMRQKPCPTCHTIGRVRRIRYR
jgi:hypothetical protein